MQKAPCMSCGSAAMEYYVAVERPYRILYLDFPKSLSVSWMLISSPV